MDLNDLYGAGSDIMDAVNDAVNRNDFSGLSSSISKTVKEVSDTIQRDVREYNEKNRREDIRSRQYRNTAGQGATNYGPNPYRRYQSQGAGYGQRMSSQAQPRRTYSSWKTPFVQKLVSKQSGSIFDLVAYGIVGGSLFGFLATAIITAAFAYMFIKGKKDHDLVKRYYEYAKAIGNAEYIDISKLAQATGRTKEEVLADIKELMDKKVFSNAWLDEQQTTLMLTEEIYRQYQEIRQQSEILRQQAEAEEGADADLPANARKIIKEGKEYIKTIHNFNDEIPGVEMSEKLYRLESTVDRIIEQVRQNPDSASELSKLISYYLPTTVKLLKAYTELDKQTVSGENIVKTKKEIEDALDTINDAFEKLLDSLFENIAWDVSSDISVMQTMFAQDGLTEREMTAEKGQSVSDMEKQVYGTTLTWGDETVTGSQAQAQTMPKED